MIVICVRRRIRNFNPNMIVVNRVVIEEPKRYKPQPTSHTDLFLNVIKDKTPLISPTTMKMITNTKLVLMIYG
jgi:hypothetical protein